MTPSEERAFETKAEKMLKGHRELPNGRDFRCFVERYRSDIQNNDFNERFDKTFSDAPGGPDWFSNKFCDKCGKRKSLCEC